MHEISICVYDLRNEKDMGFLSVTGFSHRINIELYAAIFVQQSV